MNVDALLDGSRQVAETVDGIRRDHRARYEFAASQLYGKRVVDAACGVGYGAKILAGAGCTVRAFDRSPEAIAFAKHSYNHDNRIEYDVGELYDVAFPADYDAVICFEALEHVTRPERALRQFHRMAPRLIVSVPNEAEFPYRGFAHHVRHYTQAQLDELLGANGWRAVEWFGQRDADAPVTPGASGRTIVAVCERVDLAPAPREQTLEDVRASHLLNGKAPHTVAIVAMGGSYAEYVARATKAGGRHKLADEVWAINNMGGVIQCDRVFHMDDLSIQEARAAAGKPDVGVMLDWMKTTPTPIYTSRKYDRYPSSVEYPLAFVLQSVVDDIYFNSTTAYALPFAYALGVKKIIPFGCDFSYAENPHKRERGRGCLEYWIGVGNGLGVEFEFPSSTPLMDAGVQGQARLYGYDTEYVSIEGGRGVPTTVVRTPRRPEDIPTAPQMEQRYSHDPKTDGAT